MLSSGDTVVNTTSDNPDSATVVLDGLDGGIDPAEGTPLLRVKRVPSGENLSMYAYAWR